MSTSKHTPAPWRAIFTDDEEWHGVENTDIEHAGGLIAKVYGTDEFPCVEATDFIWGDMCAKDWIFAAAPELLEALRGVLRVADRATDEFDAARAAIAKATEEHQP